jgi:hypothetical protein
MFMVALPFHSVLSLPGFALRGLSDNENGKLARV